MPRSCWLACGAVAGALAVASGGSVAIALAFGLGVGSVVLTVAFAGQRALLIAFAIGVVAILVRGLTLPASAALTGVPSGSGPWTLLVESIGSPREGHQVATVRTLSVGADGFRVAATLPRYPAVEPGDRIEVGGRVRERPDSPYGEYLERIGAWGSLDGRDMRLLERQADPGTMLESVRRGAGDLLASVLPEPEAGLAAGILIGLRDRVDRSVAAEFTTAGVSHVVAISGWNIAIVAAAIAALAGRLGRRRRAVVTAIAIVTYICFAGASPSVLRAGAMAGVVLFARETGRAGRAAAALGWAAALLLLADPRLVADAGFQLSTLATGGLIAWATPLTVRLDRWTGRRAPAWLTESLGVSLAAQAATLPIVLASFGRLALIAPVVNLAVVPLVAPAMAAGIVAMLGATAVELGAPDVAGVILATPAWVTLRLIVGIVDVAAAVPLSNISLEPPLGPVVGLGSIVIGGAAIGWWRRRQRPADRPATPSERRPERHGSRPVRLASGVLIVAVTVAGAVIVSRSSGVARISVLDVGQGDAILVEGGRGGRLLVDGGPDPERLLVELDRRIPPWDRRIDVIVLSHPHEDHVAGLALLLDRYAIGRVFEPGMRGPGPGYAALLDRFRSNGTRARLMLAAGDRLRIDDIDMRAIWPKRGVPGEGPSATGTMINNGSVVLLGTIGRWTFLLTGDIEEEVDPRLIADGLSAVDLLKVAHHGSRTATSASFVSAVRPRVAVVSVGLGNTYGHPTRATLDRLSRARARIFRTDQDGTVSVTFDATSMSVRTSPRRGALIVRTVQTGRAAATHRPSPCAVPIQPFVEPPRPPSTADRRHGTAGSLGYHPARDLPLPTSGRCPALPPDPRRWPRA